MSKVSVAMATYNGEKYIKEQLESIMQNLQSDDELIISDDGSTDKTLEIIHHFQKKDKRIKLFSGPKKGVKQNFANAIYQCHGDYIFLSDQDDIWEKNKVKRMLEYLKEYSVVIHDCKIITQNNIVIESFFEQRKSGKGTIKNIYKNTYIGCCMAFQSHLKSLILPIPDDIEMHDQWIGVLGEKVGKGCYFLNEKLIAYRRHENNVSSFQHYPLKKMIKNRYHFIKNYRKRRKEYENFGDTSSSISSNKRK